MENLKLLSTTAVLTLLIWVTADSLVSETVTLSVVLDVRPAESTSGMIVEVEQDARRVQIQVAGPRRIVESLGAGSPPRARVQLADRPTGQFAMQLLAPAIREALVEQAPDFRKVQVLAVQPSTISVHVDHIVAKRLAVTAKRLTLGYDAPPQLSRNSVTVRMRESLYPQLLESGQPPEIDIAPEFERLVRDQAPGNSVSITVALDVQPFGPDAEIIPDTVRVTATVQAQRATEVIPTVPILLAVSFANLERAYRAVTADGSTLVTRPVKVTGPPEAVARLRRGETRAYGVIQLRDADLARPDMPLLGTPDYVLPPGIRLADEPEPIEFRLVPIRPGG
ncbi:MAG TPA: hypothetical protein PKK06_04325 [Phycisphaerae bacterium]|nr:hypothetical protein [Phycisphaerae bacterium]HNU46185.1 hypothetical protein [Phycisphaerae bacterium]